MKKNPSSILYPPSSLPTPPSLPQRRAVIDVGTNSVKLLVADVAGRSITPISEGSKQTRLGSGLYETRRLQRSAIDQTADAVANYAALARETGSGSIRVIATSAARDAQNAHELVEAIREKSGLPIEILSGEQEADWVFGGVSSDPKLAHVPLLISDVGGGSTELILGKNSVQQFRSSYGLGTVRLLEQLRPGDPPGLEALHQCRAWLRKFLEEQIAPALEPALRACHPPAQLIATGGTATILARMEAKMEDFDRERIEATRLPLTSVRAHLESQWQMTLSERRTVAGLPPKRADVILTGMAIYEALMERFGFAQLRISTRGLRFFALLA